MTVALACEFDYAIFSLWWNYVSFCYNFYIDQELLIIAWTLWNWVGFHFSPSKQFTISLILYSKLSKLSRESLQCSNTKLQLVGEGGVLYWCPIFFWDSYKLHGCTAQLGLWTVYSVVLHCYILCIVSMTMNRIYMSLTTWTKCDIKHLRLNIEMVKCNCDRIEIYNVISFWICSQNSVSKEEKFPILKSFSHLDKKLLITLKNMICSSTMLCESPEYYVSLILKGLKLKVLFDCQMPLLMCKLHI